MGFLLCERCHAVLPANLTDDFFLKRLDQFARLGIGAECGPLLTKAKQ
jgi:hypothetical protein